MKFTVRSLLLLAFLFSILFVVPLRAQVADGITPATLSATSTNIVNWISTDPLLRLSSTNWTFIPYLTHARGLTDSAGKKAEWGGGIAALYPILGDLKAGPRLQLLGGSVYTMSATVQYSPSYQLFGTPIIVTPAAYTGVMLPFGGLSANGSLSAVYGAGFSFKYPVSATLDVGLGYGWEDWSNLRVKSVEHFALVINKRF